MLSEKWVSVCLKRSCAGCQRSEVHPEIHLLLRLLSDAGRAPVCVHCLTGQVRFCMRFLFHLCLVGLLQVENTQVEHDDVNCSKYCVSLFFRCCSCYVSCGLFDILLSCLFLFKSNQNMLKSNSSLLFKSNYVHVNVHVYNMHANAHSDIIKKVLRSSIAAILSWIFPGRCGSNIKEHNCHCTAV